MKVAHRRVEKNKMIERLKRKKINIRIKAETMQTHIRVLFLSLCIVFGGYSAEKTMSLDVKDTDIRDVIRMISKGYNLSIILDKDVAGKVTVHLSDVPIMEGLRSIAESHGLEVLREGSLYLIRKATAEEKSVIRYQDGKLTVDVQNVDVKDFLNELSSKTAVSIVPESEVSGKITGKLFQVDLDNGLRSVLEANGFTVKRRKNIYQVYVEDEAKGAAARRPRRRYTSKSGAAFYVDYMDGKISVDVSNGDLEEVIKAIAEQSEVQIVTYGSIKAEVNAKLDYVPLTEAIALLLGGTRYTFVQKGNIILVGDRNAATPSGQALSKTELIHLNHIKAEEITKLLPKNIKPENVKVIKEQNALLVAGTSEDIVLATEFLNTIDLPTPQVRIDALVVEFKDNLDREFGINAWTNKKGSTQESYQILPSPDLYYSKGSSHLEIGLNASDLKKMFNNIGIINDLSAEFYIALRFLESQERAKILAQPTIITLNGHKATIDVDETQYYKITTGVAENYTVRFQPIKFGISLNITPWISRGGQITAEIQPTVSNSEKTNVEGYPNVSRRAVSTTVRLRDGETLVLGGLVKNKEEEFRRKIPILGDIPIIGALFRHTGKARSKTNLVIYITPHIVTQSDTADLEAAIRQYDYFGKNIIQQGMMKGIDAIKGTIEKNKSKSESDDLPHTVPGGTEAGEKDTSEAEMKNPRRAESSEKSTVSDDTGEGGKENAKAAENAPKRPKRRIRWRSPKTEPGAQKESTTTE
jgi:type IV pilus assembly protein PilQ